MTAEAADTFRLAPQEFDPAIDVESITEHPKNVNEGDIGAIDSSMRRHGFAGGVIVQRSTRYILAGNHSYRTARMAGARTLPGFWVDFDDDQAEQFMLDHNHTGRLGRDDPSRLAEVLVSMIERTGNLPATYTRDDVDDILADLDAGSPPGEFPGYDDDAPVKYKCPRCQYRWTGNPAPPGDDG